MIRFIASNFIPSWAHLGQVLFIEKLNSVGIEASIYTTERWPQNLTTHWQDLSTFKCHRNDVILFTNFQIRSRFDLINLDAHQYSFGRKEKVRRIAHQAFRYFRYLPRTLGIRYIDVSDDGKAFAELFPKSLILPQRGAKFDEVRRDIDHSKDFLKEIDFQKETYLSGGLLSPAVFKDEVIPLLAGGKLFYTGFRLPATLDDLKDPCDNGPEFYDLLQRFRISKLNKLSQARQSCK